VLYPMRIRDFSRFGFTSVLFPELAAETDDWRRIRAWSSARRLPLRCKGTCRRGRRVGDRRRPGVQI